MKKILLYIFLILVTLFTFHYFLVGQAVYGDGIYYWSYVRSIYVDHDVHLNDEISHRYDAVGNNTTLATQIPKETPQRIALEYHLPIGPAISWLPFFALGDWIARIISLYNPSIVLNGYSDTYQIAVGIGNILYIIFGIYATYLLVRKYFNQKISIIAILLLLFATNLLYYGGWDVVNSHPFSFFISSVMLYFFFVRFSHKWYQWIFLGILIGLLILTRTQEVICSIFLLVGLVRFLLPFEKKIIQKIINFIWFGVLSFVGILVVVTPQLLLLQHVYRGVLESPYLVNGHFYFFSPHILGVLLNNKTGLLFTSPIILIGFFGLVALALHRKYIGIVGVLFFVLEYYLIASWLFWDQAASYGIRMLITTFPVVAVGIAYMLDIAVKRFSYTFVYSIGLLLVMFNLCMIVRFHLFIKTATFDVSTVTRIEAQKKLNTVLHTNFHFFRY